MLIALLVNGEWKLHLNKDPLTKLPSLLPSASPCLSPAKKDQSSLE